jgi:fructose-bisphosphate aldolase class 1
MSVFYRAQVGPSLPSSAVIERNAEELAEYALISQQAGLVPIGEKKNVS